MSYNHGYIGRAPSDSSVTVARQVFNVSGVTTDFTFSSGYDVGYLDVFINGTKIINGDDYTATDTSTISILNGGAVNGDVVEAVAYKAFNVASVDSSSGSFTVGLNLSVDSNISAGGSITGSNISAGGSITGSAFYGDGSNLSGIDHTALKDSVGTVRVQANTSGAEVTGILTTSTINTSTINVSGGAILTEFSEKVNDIGNTGANANIDLSNGSYVLATLDQNTEFSITTGISTGAIGFSMLLTNGSGGPYSIVWPSSIKWPANTTPSRTTTDAKSDLWVFVSTDNGANWYGNVAIYNFS